MRKTVIDLKVGDKGTGTQMLQSLQTNGLQETNFTAEITGAGGGAQTHAVCAVCLGRDERRMWRRLEKEEK